MGTSDEGTLRRAAGMVMMLIATVAGAQTGEFTLEDLNFGGTNYHRMTPENRDLTWWGETLVRIDVDVMSEVDKATGKETPMFSADDLNRWAGIGDSARIRELYTASLPYPGEPLVLANSGDERLLIDFREGKVAWRQELHREAHEDWSPASRAAAYVQDDNLYVMDADGAARQVTRDGSREVVYGQSVHRDEFGIWKGTFWSPSGRRLAFYRMDQGMVADYPLVDTGTRIATETPIKYPMAGEASHEVTVGVYDLDSGRTVYLDAGDPRDRYFTNIAWSPDGTSIYMIELNRDQTDMELVRYDAATGARQAVLYREHDDRYVHPMTPVAFLPWDSGKFLLQSQRDGYNHLYLLDTSGRMLRQVTSGEWVVLDLVGFNARDRSAIILSTAASPIQNNLYSIDIASGKARPLDNGRGCHGNITQADGHHGGILSPSGEWLFDNYAEPDVPRRICVTNTRSGRAVEYFAAADPWEGMRVPGYSLGTIKAADGTTDLYYRMVTPPDLDPGRKYPAIVYVYGGPGTRLVEARWHYMSRGWETYMAQKGYVMFILDNRGSAGRGRDFEQATFRRLGVEEMRDQMRGVEYLGTLEYVDTARIGVHGWSYGGFMATGLMTTYPETFKVGVAGGPVINWKWYEVMYGERYMDTPQANPEGYADTDLTAKAGNLKGRLQVIIGSDDPTVVPQHALSFIDACIGAGTQPDFFVYPGEGHNMMGHKSVHLHERISRYFDDYLK